LPRFHSARWYTHNPHTRLYFLSVADGRHATEGTVTKTDSKGQDEARDADEAMSQPIKIGFTVSVGS
jgi:hypothetical protein